MTPSAEASSQPALLPSRDHRCPRHLVRTLLGLFVVAAAVSFAFNTAFSLHSFSGPPPPLRAATTPVIVVLGDSITEYGASPELKGFVSILANDYVRRADVINRGAAGWTSRAWLAHFPTMIRDWDNKPPALVSIFLGANDAASETDALHVPIDEYAANLRDMVLQIRGAFPSCRVLLMTPPSVDDATCIWPRSNSLAGEYAKACVQLGASLNVSVVDVWTAFQPQNHANNSLHASDGLHLNIQGNALVRELWLAQVSRDMPQLSPRRLPIMFT